VVAVFNLGVDFGERRLCVLVYVSSFVF
jgi:hypothetical protein